MTDEQNKPGPGRPKKPDWDRMHAVSRLRLKVDMVSRKLKFNMTVREERMFRLWWKAIELEASCLDLEFPGWRHTLDPEDNPESPEIVPPKQKVEEPKSAFTYPRD